MTSTKSLPLKQPIILRLKVEGVKSRSCSDKIGASKRVVWESVKEMKPTIASRYLDLVDCKNIIMKYKRCLRSKTEKLMETVGLTRMTSKCRSKFPLFSYLIDKMFSILF